jgi:pyrroline-5-carboxylate reductase
MNETAPRVLLAGFGNMGQALVNGWLARGIPAESIRIVDPGQAAREAAEALRLRATRVWQPDGEDFDVVVFAVKPDKLAETAAAYRPLAGRGPVFLSIAAGKPLGALSATLGSSTPAVRAMPNTPAAVGAGMTVLCANGAASDVQRQLCADLLGAVGRVEWVDEEGLMDAVTAVSGSGPAYVFLLIECLAQAGAAAGLPPALAARLATQTVYGAGAYAAQSELDAAELRRRVTSPQGTTEAALKVLMADDALGALLRRAVRAATERSRELSAP